MEFDHILECGTIFKGSPGFGSEYDSILEANAHLLILICDLCLKYKRDNIFIVKTTKPEPIVEIKKIGDDLL